MAPVVFTASRRFAQVSMHHQTVESSRCLERILPVSRYQILIDANRLRAQTFASGTVNACTRAALNLLIAPCVILFCTDVLD